MKNIKVAFNVLKNEQNLPAGYLQITTRLLFDIKLEFTHKMRLITGC
jgi:hypothetical protein